tara:strand:+ start:5520 stop:5777 length:258 start_codon:yes stop_codon:yes gene_type:complete
MHMDKEILMQELADNECLLADGYESALVGITEGMNPVAVYDAELCIKYLMDHDDMSEEDAVDFFYFNTVGSYVGEKTPIFTKTIK